MKLYSEVACDNTQSKYGRIGSSALDKVLLVPGDAAQLGEALLSEILGGAKVADASPQIFEKLPFGSCVVRQTAPLLVRVHAESEAKKPQ